MDPRTSHGIRELKFLLECEPAARILSWMRRELLPDPHGGAEHLDSYRVQSIYLDTPGFDVFHRRGSNGRAKFRIRRYGDGTPVFLERKLKRGGVVRKRRVAVDPASIVLAEPGTRRNGWEGDWFAQRLALRRLAPKVLLNYHRVARVGRTTSEAIRVTLDRELRAVPWDALGVPSAVDGPDLLGGSFVLEVKFSQTLPASVRQIIEEFGLQTAPCSKYRLAVHACGLAVPEASAGKTGQHDLND